MKSKPFLLFYKWVLYVGKFSCPVWDCSGIFLLFAYLTPISKNAELYSSSLL